MRIRLTGQGEVGPGGGPAGDLYVEVHERPHDVFTRDGEDLHCRVTLPMTSAALGTTLNLKTLDGEEDLDIEPGTQSGSVLTLRAHGAPRLRGTGRGNLLVHVEVVDADPARRRAGEAAARAGRAARRGPAGVQPRGAGRAVLPGARRLQRTLTVTTTDAGRPELDGAPLFLLDALPETGELLRRRRRGPARRRGAAAGAGGAGAGRRRPGHGRRGRGRLRRSAGPARRGARPLRGARRRGRSSCWCRRCPRATAGPLAVDLATELGVDRIVPWTAARCVTRWRDDRVAKGVAKWRAAARAASKQSRRPRVPEVTEPMSDPRGLRAARRRRPRAWCCTSRPAVRWPG